MSSKIKGEPPLYAGLSLNKAASRIMALVWLMGVTGGPVKVLEGDFRADPLLGNNEKGIGET